MIRDLQQDPSENDAEQGNLEGNPDDSHGRGMRDPARPRRFVAWRSGCWVGWTPSLLWKFNGRDCWHHVRTDIGKPGLSVW